MMKRRRRSSQSSVSEIIDHDDHQQASSNSSRQRGIGGWEGLDDDGLFYDCLYDGEESNLQQQISSCEEDFITNKICEVEHEIDMLSDNGLKEAYYIALREEIKQRMCYVRSKEFVLAFLRSENFNSTKTAIRLSKFLQYKAKLFGRKLLPIQIQQHHLNQHDIQCLYGGVFTIDTVDYAGRLIIFAYGKHAELFLNETYKISLMRVIMYTIMYQVHNNKRWDQNKGIVVIRYGLNMNVSLRDYRYFGDCSKMMSRAMPFKFAAIHNFSNNSALYRACFQFNQMIMPNSIISKMKLHKATCASTALSLLSHYGINIDELPLTTKGDFRMNFFQNIIKQMRKKEEEEELSSKNNTTVVSWLLDDDDDYDDQLLDNDNDHLPALLDSNSEVDETVVVGDDNNLTQNTTALLSLSLSTDKPNSSEPHHLNEDYNTATNADLTTANGPPGSGAGYDAVTAEEHFPSRLMEILQSNKVPPDTIWWSRDGTAFIINRKKFSDIVLINEFGGIKFASFARRLTRWGFQRNTEKKVATGCVEYQHKCFQRNKVELLEKWDAVDNNTTNTKQQQQNLSSLPIEKKQDVVVMKFPLKLKNAIEKQHHSNNNNNNNNNNNSSQSSSSSIYWILNGKAIVIEMKQFAIDILRKDFKGIQVHSFLRIMQKWGFTRLSKDQIQSLNIGDNKNKNNNNNNIMVFQHNLFQKNLPIPHDTTRKFWMENGIIYGGRGFDFIDNEKGIYNKRRKQQKQATTTTTTVLSSTSTAPSSSIFTTTTTKTKTSSLSASYIIGETFPKKLYRILQNTNQNQHGVWWLDSGTAFAIIVDIFAREILTKDYGGIKFNSFKRNLQRWGFKPDSHYASMVDRIVYKHPLFQKSFPDLLDDWGGGGGNSNNNKS